jgi:hypothetical protein
MCEAHRSSAFAWGRLIVVLLIGSVLMVGNLVLGAVIEGSNPVFLLAPEAKPWVLNSWKDKGELLTATGAWNGLPSGRFATQEECREALHAQTSPIYTR